MANNFDSLVRDIKKKKIENKLDALDKSGGTSNSPSFAVASNNAMPELKNTVVNNTSSLTPLESKESFRLGVDDAPLYVPRQKTQAEKDANYIKNYESMPDYGLIERAFDSEKSDDYALKQSMYSKYRQLKDDQIKSFLDNNKEYSKDLISNLDQYVRYNPSGEGMSSSQVSEYKNLIQKAKDAGITTDQLVEYMDNVLNVNQNFATDFANEHPVLATVGSALLNPFESASNLLGNAVSYLEGNPIGSDRSMNSDIVNTMRGTVREGIDNPFGSFMYDIGNSALDMGTSMLTGNPTASLALMSAEASSNALSDMKDKDVAPWKMVTTAGLSGLIEAATEKIPLDNLMDVIKTGGVSTGRDVVLNILKQAGTEASEEAISEIANNIVDYTINGGESDYERNIRERMANGEDYNTARLNANVDIWKNVGMSALAGGVSGGLMAGGASAINYLNGGRTAITQNNQTADEFYSENAELTDRKEQNRIDAVNKRIAEEEKYRPTDMNDFRNFLPLEQETSAVNNTVENNSSEIVPANYESYNGKEIDGIEKKNVKVGLNGNVNQVLSSLINMYGTDNAKILYQQFNQQINAALQTGNRDLFFDAIDRYLPQIENELSGRTYEVKKKRGSAQRNGKAPSTTYTYTDDSFIDTFIQSEDINRLYNENIRNKNANLPQTAYNNEETQNLPTDTVEAVEKAQKEAQAYPSETPIENIVDEKPASVEQPTVTQPINTESNYYDPNPGKGKELNRGYNDTVIDKTDVPTDIKNEFIQDPQVYNQLSNVDTEARADEVIANNSLMDAVQICKDMTSSMDAAAVPLAYKLSKLLNEAGNNSTAVQLISDIMEKMTKAGQFNQAAVITMMHGNPVSAEIMLQKEIAKLNKEGREKYGKKWKDFELTESEKEMFKDIKVGDETAIKEAYQKVYDRINREYPASMYEKMMEYRRVAMLCNARTNVRNLAGNSLMMGARWTADRVQALGEHAYALIDSDYKPTQSLTGKQSAQTKELVNEVWEGVKDKLLGQSNYEEMSDAVRQKQMFKGSEFSKAFDNITNGALTKACAIMGKDNVTPSLMETVRTLNYYLLEKGDDIFVKRNFTSRLGSYIEARGITDISQIPPDAIQLAMLEAEKATFHDDSSFAKSMQGIRDNLGFFGQIIMPFAKTPANIAARSVDYSPVGLAKSFYDMNKTSNEITRAKQDLEVAKQENNRSKIIECEKTIAEKNLKMQKSITGLAQGVTGTAAIALGMILLEKGIIVGSLSSDKDEETYQRAMGMLPYSFKIGDNYYTFDWAAPAAAPLILGVALKESMDEESSAIDALSKGASAAVTSWMEMTPLKNLSELFDSSKDFGKAATDVALDFPLSFIPAQLGAIARTVDPVQREYYVKGDKLSTMINSAKSKIPGLTQTLPESKDIWGNTKMRQNTVGEAALANLIAPWQTGNAVNTANDDEISRLYKETGETNMLPNKANRYYTFDKEVHNLDNEQYSKMQEITGQNTYAMVNSFINSNAYKDLSDADRSSIISKLNDFSENLAKSELLGYNIESSNYKKAYSVYKEKGPEAVSQYYGITTVLEGIDNKMDKISKLNDYNMSDEDKGYYYEKVKGGDLSKSEKKILKYYGYEGLWQNCLEDLSKENVKNKWSDKLDQIGYK